MGDEARGFLFADAITTLVRVQRIDPNHARYALLQRSRWCRATVWMEISGAVRITASYTDTTVPSRSFQVISASATVNNESAFKTGRVGTSGPQSTG